MRVASVYVPNGRSLDSPEYPRKLAFLDACRRAVAAARRAPLVIAGDFNIAPADLDVYDPAAFVGGTHVSAPERERLSAILDAGDSSTPTATCTPTRSGTPGGTTAQGHFHKAGAADRPHAARRPLAAASERCGIDRNFRKGQKPSDHAPLLLELAADGTFFSQPLAAPVTITCAWRRVLVVDDEPAVQRALERALKLESYEVALAGDGEAGARRDRRRRRSTR